MHLALFDLLRLPADQARRRFVSAVPSEASDEDEDVAGRSDARLLITAPSRELVETLAMRIHAVNRPTMPFVQVSAGALPGDACALNTMCVSLLDRARGGTLFVANVEDMSVAVQASLLDVIDAIQDARSRSAAVRLISGTTVSLLDRVSAGAFSEPLFYRLNLLHVRIPTSSRHAASTVR